MSKDDVLFAIIGLLLGFILGYMLTNSYNQKGLVPAAGAPAANAPGPEQQPDAPTAQELAQAQETAQSQADNFEAQLVAGDMLYRARRYAEASNFFTKANKIKPDAIEPMIALGNVNYDDARDNNANEKWPVAEKWYAVALAKDPSRINVRTDLGLTFMFREPPNYDRAIENFRKSLEINPNHEPTLQNIIVAYSKKKNANEAKATLAKLEQVNPQNEALPALREELAKLK